MKRGLIIIISLLSIALASCVEAFDGDVEIKGGEAVLKLDINTGAMKTRSVLSEADEKAVNNLYVLVFDSSGDRVAGKYFPAYNSSGVSMTVNAGNSMMVYVVANVKADASENVINALDAVTTETGLKSVVVGLQPLVLVSPDSSRGILSVGSSATAVNILPNQNNIVNIDLRFVHAKINLNVIDDVQQSGHSVEVLGWAMVDLPKKTYLFGGAADGVNPANGADFETSPSRNGFDVDNSGSNTVYKSAFYMFENRRGGRVANGATPPTGYIPGPIGSVNDKDKAWYAPAKATHVLVYGLYHRAGFDSEAIRAVIYLGQNNHSDYNVSREELHTYNVTIKGIDDILIDSNIEEIESSFNVEIGDNLTMDAHPDLRAFRISGAAFKDQSGMVHTSHATIEVFDENDRRFDHPGFSATWLKVSPVDLYHHQASRSANDPWQQAAPGGAKYLVRTRYIPHVSYREANPGKSWSGWPAGSDPFYNDNVLTMENATYRMCYMITEIPFTQSTTVTSNTLYLYADEFESIGGSRSAKVKVTYKQGLTSRVEERNFTVSQHGSVYVGLVVDKCNVAAAGLSGLSYKKMVIEKSEETTFKIYPNFSPNLQNKGTMQWGLSGTTYYNVAADKFRNGYFLTPNLIYYKGSSQKVTKDADGGNVAWSTVYDFYRSKYGSGHTDVGGSTSSIGEPLTATIGSSPYSYPDINAHVYHAIYKSNAPRYCHEKNRDLNGDGRIDESEAKWYLPSLNELQQIWVSQESIKDDMPLVPTAGSGKDGKYYWSATESGSSTTNALGFTIGHTSGASHTGGKTMARHVRCVRAVL